METKKRTLSDSLSNECHGLSRSSMMFLFRKRRSRSHGESATTNQHAKTGERAPGTRAEPQTELGGGPAAGGASALSGATILPYLPICHFAACPSFRYTTIFDFGNAILNKIILCL